MPSRRFEIEFPLYVTSFGVMLVVYALKKIKRQNQIRNIAKQMISSASAGEVEIEGIAWPIKSIDHSMKGEKIVFRQMIIQEEIQRRKKSGWVTVWEKHERQPFLVFDQSGFMIIKVEDNFVIDELVEYKYDPHHLTPLQLESFKRFYDHKLSNFSTSLKTGFLSSFFSSSTYRILERSIAIGSPLLVHGHHTPEEKFRYIHIDQEFALFKERVTKLLQNINFQKTLFDKNKDSVVDAKELYNGFRSTLKASVKNEILTTDFKSEGLPVTKVYGTITSTNDQSLQILDCFEEQHLRSRPTFLNWIWLYLGAGVIALGLFLLKMGFDII